MVEVCTLSTVTSTTIFAFVPLSRNECARTMAPNTNVNRKIRKVIPLKARLTRKVAVTQKELSIRQWGFDG